MKKKIVRLTESDLQNLITNTVRKVLVKEDFEPEYSVNPEDQPDFDGNGMSVTEQLDQIREIIADIADSGFIPFSSPAPSSTEKEVKDLILMADKYIEKAIEKCQSLGY